MPRLVGKKPNYTLLILPIVIVAVLGAAVVQMEYNGTTNLVPEFGRDRLRKQI
jgi:hypothetical protein